jgi:hypothetical protein
MVEWANTNAGAKIIASLIIWGFAFIPAYFFFFIRFLIGPEGFWQELALILACCVLVGWLQALLIFLGVLMTIAILATDL